MRYQQNASVDAVLAHLKTLGVVIAARNFHAFFVRLLRVLPLAQAPAIGVDKALLRAVRVRHGFPLDPYPSRLSAKRLPRHDSRLGRRPVASTPKPMRPKVPPPQARPPRRDRLDPHQLPLAGMVAATPSEPGHPYTRMHGTPENPKDYHDWKLINEVAREKLLDQDWRVEPNWVGGTVVHRRTRRSYTPEDLVREFYLTSNEAQSCFMTFDA